MKDINEYLNEVAKLERKQYPALAHEVHKQHNISKRTLFYIREYGVHSNVPHTIIKESIKILLFASILSSLGGLAFENIKETFISLIPLIILFPVLNDQIGGYGGVVSSKFSSMLHEGKIEGRKWWKNKELNMLFAQILIASIITAVLGALFALVISFFSDSLINQNIAYKVFSIAIIDSLILVTILFFIAIYAGMYFFKKQEDPNNFLIPITTSIADFGNMLLLAVLIVLFF